MKFNLRECPFCTGILGDGTKKTEIEILMAFDKNGTKVYAECECGATGPPGKTAKEAIANWNRRRVL